MRKLRLTLEALQIESFTTDASSSRRGTVRGRSTSVYTDTYCTTTLTEDVTYCIQRCGPGETAEDTCAVSCGYGVCPQTPNTACEM